MKNPHGLYFGTQIESRKKKKMSFFSDDFWVKGPRPSENVHFRRKCATSTAVLVGLRERMHGLGVVFGVRY